MAAFSRTAGHRHEQGRPVPDIDTIGAMPRTNRQTFDHLSSRERAVVGDPDDYDWEAAISLPARERPAVTHPSVGIRTVAPSRSRRASVEPKLSKPPFDDDDRLVERGNALGLDPVLEDSLPERSDLFEVNPP